jgi:N6-L-threonylcarbamoyladenine synthase
MIVLGIDSSCDDTSLALVRDGREILSNVVSSQVGLHRLFGGVVPELASRKHVEIIDTVYREALTGASQNQENIDVIAVTSGPGLIGSLLVGLCFAKGLSLSLQKPLVAVNHVIAHATSIFLEREVSFPYVALVVSGGHTTILRIDDVDAFHILGTTRDDAAGEAFDKIAKFLGIGYPGGKAIEELSEKGRGNYVFFPRPMRDDKNYDFSFSGLKTSFINYIKKNGITDEHKSDILSSFQEAAFEVLADKTVRAAVDSGLGLIVVGGGVASNRRLREVLREAGSHRGIEVLFSSPQFCTDNGAMVASVGCRLAERGIFSGIDVQAFSRMRLSPQC